MCFFSPCCYCPVLFELIFYDFGKLLFVHLIGKHCAFTPKYPVLINMDMLGNLPMS